MITGRQPIGRQPGSADTTSNASIPGDGRRHAQHYDAPMPSIVITAIGDDRAGLVQALSGAIVAHGGNWDRSHMAERAGKFAGVVLVTVPASSVQPLLNDLETLRAEGLLQITAEQASTDSTDEATQRLSLELVGQDHPGIVHDISEVLASRNISIDELETEVGSAPQGGSLFTARASLELRADVSIDDLKAALEDVAHDLMVDLELSSDKNAS